MGIGLLSALTVRPQAANGIKAIVHDSIITYDDVEDLTAQTATVLRNQFRTRPDEFQKKMEEARAENLEKLLGRELILHEFKTAGYNMPETIIDELVQERIQEKYGGNRITLTKTLQAQGVSHERFRQEMREQFIVEALRQKNISSEIIISPHKVEKYYQAHRDEFKVEDEVKLRILVLTKPTNPEAPNPQKLVEEILTKLKEGASFSEMAVYSQDARSSQEGKWYERDQLTKGLADVAFGLEAGQFSGVLSRSAGDDYWICKYEGGLPTTAKHYGVDSDTKKEHLIEELSLVNDLSAADKVPVPREFFIMLVEDKRTAHFKPLGDVREQIERSLLLEERNRIEKQWIERLKKKTFVRYF
jgi:peptidyl-prolyl cis-trans isomerase SurA